MRRLLFLLPLALAGGLSGCVAYTPELYGPAPHYPAYPPPVHAPYYAPPPVVVRPPPIVVTPRPDSRRWRDRDRDGVPDRFDRFPRDPRWR